MNSDLQPPSYYRNQINICGVIILVGIIIALCGSLQLSSSEKQYNSVSAEGSFNCTMGNGQPCPASLADQMSNGEYSRRQAAKTDIESSAGLIWLGGIIVVCALFASMPVSNKLRQARIEALDYQYEYMRSHPRTPSAPAQESEQAKLYCPHCGTMRQSEDKYCSKCGKQISE
jgi:hypothetical protein